MKITWIYLLALWTPLAAETLPWTTETASTISWKAVEDDNGGFYLLWSHQDSGGTRLLGQHITATGVPLWTIPGQTFLPVLGDTASWTAFADSNKGLALTWVQDNKVWVQRWTSDGQPVWKLPVKVSDTRFVASSPAGVADGGGGVYLCGLRKCTPIDRY